MPSGTAMTVAMVSPASTRPRLGSRLPTASVLRNRWLAGPENQVWYIRATIADGGGKNALWLCSVHSSQMPTPQARTTQRHSQVSGGQARPAPFVIWVMLGPRAGLTRRPGHHARAAAAAVPARAA